MFKPKGFLEFKLGDRAFHFLTEPDATWEEIQTIAKFLHDKAVSEIEKAKEALKSEEEKKPAPDVVD